MSNSLEFTVVVDQNPSLPEDAREVEALVSVTARDREGHGVGMEAPKAAEVLIIDCSGSMEMPRDKIERAKEAAAAAIDQLRDGVAFAVVAGSDKAEVLWPPQGVLVPADAASRAEAKEALRRLWGGGGTAIGQWLLKARALFAGFPGAIRHAILLTDGKNEHETPVELARVLEACEGQFTCDCRGVGVDWVVDELRSVASALLGTLRMVAEPADLAADFRAAIEAAMQNALADVRLRITTPEGASVRFVKQVYPTIEELADRRVEAGERVGDYPTGSWRPESRDYHIGIDVEPGNVGDRMMAGRVELVIPVPDGTEYVAGHGLVLAKWTSDPAESTPIPFRLGEAKGQEDLAELIQKGVDALDAHDPDAATDLLGRARAIAVDLGLAEKITQLDRMVEVDPETGTVELRQNISQKDKMEADVYSSTTSQVSSTGVESDDAEEQ